MSRELRGWRAHAVCLGAVGQSCRAGKGDSCSSVLQGACLGWEEPAKLPDPNALPGGLTEKPPKAARKGLPRAGGGPPEVCQIPASQEEMSLRSHSTSARCAFHPVAELPGWGLSPGARGGTGDSVLTRKGKLPVHSQRSWPQSLELPLTWLLLWPPRKPWTQHIFTKLLLWTGPGLGSGSQGCTRCVPGPGGSQPWLSCAARARVGSVQVL